jgi:peptide/nickel transport system ATP-binding protein
MTPNPPLLDLRDVRVRYQTPSGPLFAVDGVDLTIQEGETLGLVGESGCGKSTLARSILGLLPEGASASGTFDFGGRDLLKLSREEMRRIRGDEISLIFQEPMTRLDPLLRIEDHFLQMMRAHRSKLNHDEAKRSVREALSSMGIPPNRARQYPHEFSGGMRQRIMIALGIVLKPRLVIADEPTTALDVLVEAQILEILKSLTALEEVSVLLITHNLGIVAETCERVAVMYAGKIIEVGPVEEVFARPKHPYTEGLLASVIHLDSERLQSIAGSPPDLLDPPAACRFHPRCPYVMPICSQIEPPPVITEHTRVNCWLHGPNDQMAAAQ